MGRGSGASGARGGGGGGAQQQASQALESLGASSSLGERTRAINQALSAGLTDSVVAAAKDYPKGTVLTVFKGIGGTSSFTKTGGRGKDGWRSTKTFEKTSTASILLYSGANSISASKG